MQSFKLLPINSVAEAIYNNHVKGNPCLHTSKIKKGSKFDAEDIVKIKIDFYFNKKDFVTIAEEMNCSKYEIKGIIEHTNYKHHVAPFEKVYLKRAKLCVDINYEYDVDSLVRNS